MSKYNDEIKTAKKISETIKILQNIDEQKLTIEEMEALNAELNRFKEAVKHY